MATENLNAYPGGRKVTSPPEVNRKPNIPDEEENKAEAQKQTDQANEDVTENLDNIEEAKEEVKDYYAK
jgi:hypothetical protein